MVVTVSNVCFGPGFVENSSLLLKTKNDLIWVRCLVFETLKAKKKYRH